MKKHVYRKGDRIRILRPRVVERVGYPKSVFDYLPSDTDRDMLIAAEILRGSTPEDAIRQIDHQIEIQKKWRHSTQSASVHPKVLWAAAYFRAKEDKFGGKERSIHYKQLYWWRGARYSSLLDEDGNTLLDPESFVPFETIVASKRVVKTGTYVAPSSWHDSYTGEYDYDPGGLEDMKTHVIIRTHEGEFHTDDIEPVKEK